MNGDLLGRVVQPGSNLVQFMVERFHPRNPPKHTEWTALLPVVVWVRNTGRPSPDEACLCPVQMLDEISVRAMERHFKAKFNRTHVGVCSCMGRLIE